MISITHIDTCLSCYVTDHHNRDGEWMFGVFVDGTTTYADIYTAAVDEIKIRPERVRGLSQDDLRDALAECFSEPERSAIFDSSLDAPSDDDYIEPCQAWFLVTWPTDELGEDETEV